MRLWWNKSKLSWSGTNWIWLLGHYPCYKHSFGNLECSFFVWTIEIDDFSIESSVKNVNFLIGTIFESINPDCMEKNRFEFWSESKNWNFWALSVCFAFVLAQKAVFFQGCAASRMLYKRKLFDCKLFWKSQSLLYGEKQVWILMCVKKLNFVSTFIQFRFWLSPNNGLSFRAALLAGNFRLGTWWKILGW